MSLMKKFLQAILISLIVLTITGIVFAEPTVKLVKPVGGETVNLQKYLIDFNVSDSKDKNLVAAIFLDDDKNKENGFIKTLVSNLDLEKEKCVDGDANNQTVNACSFEWQVGDVNGYYFLGIEVQNTDGNRQLVFTNNVLKVDAVAPEISGLTPSNGAGYEKTNAVISAVLMDKGFGVNKDSIRLTVEGKTYNLTNFELRFDADKNKLEFNAGEIFSLGQLVKVKLLVEDNAQNKAEKEWQFTVNVKSPSTTPSQPTQPSPQTPVTQTQSISGTMSIHSSVLKVFTEKGSSFSVPFTLKNNALEKVCSKLSVESKSKQVNGSILLKEVCLNQFEETESTALIVLDKDLNKGEYKLELVSNANNSVAKEVITILVDSNKELEVEQLNSVVNSNKPRDLMKLRLWNKTNYAKNLKLKVFSSYLMPFFEESEIKVDANNFKDVKLFIQPLEELEEKKYSLEVVVEEESKLFKKDLSVELKKMRESIYEFTSEKSYEMPQKSSKTIELEVTNKSNRKQTVKLVSDSALITEFSEKQVSLDKWETKKVKLRVETREETLGSKVRVEVFAFNEFDNTKYEFEVKIKLDSLLQLSFPERIEVNTEESERASIELMNSFTEKTTAELTVELMDGNWNGLEVKLDKNKLELEPNKAVSVKVSVNAASNAEAGWRKLNLKIKTANKTLEQIFRVHVIGKDKVKFEAFPSLIELNEEEEKEIQVTVLNSTNSSIKNLKLVGKNLPKEAELEEVKISEIKAGETLTLKTKIKALKTEQDLNTSINLMVEGENYSSKQSIKLNVKDTVKTVTATQTTNTTTASPKEKGQTDGILTGFASLAPVVGIGLVILILIILIILSKINLSKKEEVAEAVEEAQSELNKKKFIFKGV